jgi:hypothetical protein
MDKGVDDDLPKIVSGILQTSFRLISEKSAPLIIFARSYKR